MSETSLVLPDAEIPAGAAPIAELDLDEEPQLDPIEDPSGQVQFDPTPFTIDVPKVDGIHAEKIVVSFSGSVELDIHDEKDLALFNSLTLGREIELRVSGTVADRISPLKTDKETGAQTMIRKAKIAVDSLYVLTPEEL
jgi:hypothetical protein